MRGYLVTFLSGLLAAWAQPAEAQPKGAPEVWRRLQDMPQALGRYAIAALDDCIYLLGGVDYNIRAGENYDESLWRFDPRTQEWKRLPACPVGTGGAVMVADDHAHRLIVLGGIRTLGDPLPRDHLDVAIYLPAQQHWTTHRRDHEGLGRPMAAFPYEGSVYFITTRPARWARLHVDQPSPEVIEGYPIDDEIATCTQHDGTAFVCTAQRAELWKCDVGRGEWERAGRLTNIKLDLDDLLFTDGEHLLLWANRWSSGPADTAIYEVDLAGSRAVLRHRALPGPPCRRSSNGVVYGGKLYVFGGQRRDDEWLRDVWVYDIVRGQEYGELGWVADLRLDWAIEALSDARATERWVWEVLADRRPQIILDRMLELPDAPRRRIRWLLLRALMGDLDADLAYLWSLPPAEVLAEAKELWPIEIEPSICARSVVGPVAHDVVIISVDKHGSEQARLTRVEVIRERVYLFEQSPPWCGSGRCGVLNIGRTIYSPQRPRGERWDSRGFGGKVPSGITIRKISLEDPGQFQQNAVAMPEEVLPLIPEPYRRDTR